MLLLVFLFFRRFSRIFKGSLRFPLVLCRVSRLSLACFSGDSCMFERPFAVGILHLAHLIGEPSRFPFANCFNMFESHSPFLGTPCGF